MTAEPRCECCDLPVSSCGKAAGTRARAEHLQEQRRLRALGFMPAAYPGVCSACGEPFRPGTLIRADRPSGWRCCA